MLAAKKSIKRFLIFSEVVGCNRFKCKNCLLTLESVATLTGLGKASVLVVWGNLTRGNWSCWCLMMVSRIDWVSWSRIWMELEEVGLLVNVEVDGGRFGEDVMMGRRESNNCDNSWSVDPSVIIPKRGESHLFWLLGVSNLKIKSSNWSTGYLLVVFRIFHSWQVSSRAWQWITRWGVEAARAWQYSW